MEILNAKIESTRLGREDHGIMTIWLQLDFGDSSHQGWGGYALDKHDGDARIPHVSLAKHITKILDTVGVDSWEDLNGEYIRIKRESGWNGKILAIGNLLKDEWFNPED